ncbi:polysaccharide biosynthesis tyrosine autokinase [bacterium]|nr:polysaccharide biosynthesis tyrosine autokinase [bacterium]
MKKELTLQDYVRLVLRRRWIIVSATAGVLLATAVYMLFSPPVYESASVFMLETQNLSFTEKGMMLAEQTRPLGYYQAIMRSRLYRNRVFDIFFQDMPEEIPGDFDSKEFFSVFQEGVSLASAEYTDFITLRARANNPDVAYRIAVLATEVLKNRCQEIDREELQNAVDFIDQQTMISKTKLEEAETALQEFRRRTKITVIDEEGGLLNELLQMENKLTEIETSRQLSAAAIAGYRRRLSSDLTLETAPELGSRASGESVFQKEVADLETRRQRLIEEKGEFDPGVRALESEIDQKKRAYVNQIIQQSVKRDGSMSEADLTEIKNWQERLIDEEVNLFTLENQERHYKQLIEEFKAKHPNIMDQSIELIGLMRAQKVAENLYNFLLEKGEEAKIKAATGTGGIRIVDNPVFPQHPVPVNVMRNLVLGLILGLGLGFGLALVKEYTDNAIYTKTDITQDFELTVVGEIPAYGGLRPRDLPFFKGRKGSTRDKHLTEGPLLTQMPLKSGTSEAFRSFRSNLHFANVDQDLKSIVISSSNAEEGKSLTSANLAIAYALLGEDVILVDADLRKPRLHKLFECQKSPGLTECLVEGVPVDQVVQKTKTEHLYIVPAGKTPPNPSEIMSSKRMAHFIGEIESRGKLVLFDSAPLLPVTDTFVLASMTDGMILIVKHGHTSRFDIEHVTEMLTNAKVNIVGVVLNQIPVTRGYGYYYYYGKSYRGYY